MRLLAVLLTLALGFPAAARTRAAGGRIAAARRILVVTAHPDDELLLAPLLGDRCVRDGISCAILVMTTGDYAGLGDVRAAEMARSAALLHLRLTQWTLPDVLENVNESWSANAGDHATLVRRLHDLIAIENPDLILTFDPAHGSTGHPAHRLTGALVLESGARNVVLLETKADGLALSSAVPLASVYNGDWEWVVRVAETHASQFTREQVDVLRNLPAGERRVWLAEDRVVR